MKKIEDRQDIEELVTQFYTQALTDDVIGVFFNEVKPLDFEKHFPVMFDFWESVLLGSGNYRGNPMIKHIQLSQLKKLEDHHFERWLQLWKKTILSLFYGDKADEAITKAQTIAKMMMYKIENSGHIGFVQ